MTAEIARQFHEVLARRLCRPLRSLQRVILPYERATLAAFRHGMAFREQAASWSDDHKRDWVLVQLRRIVRYADRHSPFYRERFKAVGFDAMAPFDFSDYRKLPILSRTEVQDAGERLLTNTLRPGEVCPDATGGSSGKPVRIWTGPEERGWRESGDEHFMRRLGLPAGTRRAVLWGHHLDPSPDRSITGRLKAFAKNEHSYETFRLSRDTLMAYHRDLQLWRPAYILAYASGLTSLAEEVHSSGERPFYPAKAFITGAEKLYAHQRATISSTFGRPIHERYGGRDVGNIGFQLEPWNHLAYDVDWANLLVEPRDGYLTGTELIVTKLHADAMPLIRYNIEDVCHFPPSSSPGHPCFRLLEVVGRVTDRIYRRNGSWIDGIVFPHLLKEYPVLDFQVHQHAEGDLTIKLVTADGFTKDMQGMIINAIRSNVPDVPVSMELVTGIPRTSANKWRPVISDFKRT